MAKIEENHMQFDPVSLCSAGLVKLGGLLQEISQVYSLEEKENLELFGLQEEVAEKNKLESISNGTNPFTFRISLFNLLRSV